MNNEVQYEPAPSAQIKEYKPMPVVAIVFCSLGVLFGLGWAYFCVNNLISLAKPYDPHAFNILGDWGKALITGSAFTGILAIGHLSTCGPLLLFKTRKQQTPRKVWLPVTITISAVLLVSLILSILLCSASHYSYKEPTYTYKGVTYSYYETSLKKGVVITGIAPGTESGEILELPSEINGTEVQYINEQAFKNNTKIKEVILPDTMQFIEEEAFCGCSSLKKVRLPEHLHKIYDNAFRDCPSLTDINEPGTYLVQVLFLYSYYSPCEISKSAFSGSSKNPRWLSEYKKKEPELYDYK